jgi:hypothetical protein
MGDKTKTKLTIAAASLGILQNVLAKGTPWQAGYDHGCSDANANTVIINNKCGT